MQSFNFVVNGQCKRLALPVDIVQQSELFGNAKAVTIKDIALPSWLSPQEYVLGHREYDAMWNAGIDRDTIPEAWQRQLLLFSATWKINAIARLINTTAFNNKFIASLCRQLKTWLDTEYMIRQYPNSPFSKRQWDILYQAGYGE